MKTPEEIKKGLEHCHACRPCIDQCPYGDIRDTKYSCETELLADAIAYIRQLEQINADFAERMERLEAQFQKWISIYTQMPNDGQHVLAVNGDGVMEVLYYDKKWPNAFCGCGGLLKVYNITHWMPLPGRPER